MKISPSYFWHPKFVTFSEYSYELYSKCRIWNLIVKIVHFMSIQFPLALQLWPRYFYNFVCFQHTNPEFFVHFPPFPTYAYLCHKKFIFYNLNLIKLGIWIYVIISFCTTILDIKENEFQFQGKILSDILPAYLLWALFKIKGKITYRVLQFYFLSFLSKVFCHQFKYIIFLTLICFQVFYLIETL